MGSNRSWYIIWVIFSLSVSTFGRGLDSLNPDSLDAFIYDYAYKALVRPHTGTLNKVSLPANFSGMDVSLVRIRSGSFWARGANFSSFHIPPRIIPLPYVKRLAIVYENLGNWSSYYYKVPGYSLITPVVGFMAYDASNVSKIGNVKLKLSIRGDPILVRFPQLPVPEDKHVTMKCVKFGAGGSVEFSNMTLANVCVTRGQGRFSVAVPSKKKERLWKWWAIGFGAGFVGLVLVGMVGIVIFKLCRMKKIGEMERQFEKGVAFETIWIGRSKMPSASVIRTQPVLEHEDVP